MKGKEDKEKCEREGGTENNTSEAKRHRKFTLTHTAEINRAPASAHRNITLYSQSEHQVSLFGKTRFVSAQVNEKLTPSSIIKHFNQRVNKQREIQTPSSSAVSFLGSITPVGPPPASLRGPRPNRAINHASGDFSNLQTNIISRSSQITPDMKSCDITF